MKQRMTALATAREISIIGLLMRALDAYAAPEVGDGVDNYKHIDFAPLLALGAGCMLFRAPDRGIAGLDCPRRRRGPHSENGVARSEGEHQRR